MDSDWFCGYKYNKRRAQRQIENNVFAFDDAEPHPILSKYSESRAQWQIENKVFAFDECRGRILYYQNIVKSRHSTKRE